MTPHPDFKDLDVPTKCQLGAFALNILTAADLEEDYHGVMSSTAVLTGLFGGTWPVGLTKADDEIDLHWHHREFTTKRSFAWVIRDASGAYIGCAYLFPDWLVTGSGRAVYWVVDRPDRLSVLEAFGPLYVAWLKDLLVDGYDLEVLFNSQVRQATASS